jgi:hypothetical protein
VERLNREDALEIIENSICKHQKDAILH